MKKLLIFIIILSGNLYSQNIKTLEKYALRDAKATTKASLEKDPNTLLKYTHPKISKKYGESQLLETMEDVFRTMSAQKIKITDSKINEVTEIKKEGKEYRCLVKNTINMDFNGRAVTIKSSLFGFYDKKKSQWYFVESNKLLDDDEMKEVFPNFRTDIEIPLDEQIAEN